MQVLRAIIGRLYESRLIDTVWIDNCLILQVYKMCGEHRIHVCYYAVIRRYFLRVIHKKPWRAQAVGATLARSLSAGVLNPKVFRGR